MRFRPGGLVVGPGRATRRGYQRAAGPPQSTGGQRTPADGAGSRVRCPGHVWPCSPAAATCWPTRSAPAAWARSGAPGTATSAAGSRPSWLAADDAASLQRFARERGAAGAAPPRRAADGPRRPLHHGPGARRRPRAAARAARSAARQLRARGPGPGARGPGGGARSGAGAPRRQAGQPPPRAHRHRPAVGPPRRLRHRGRVPATPGSREHPAASAPAATCLPSRSPAPRPTRGRTCTPRGWSRPSC